MLVAAPVYGRDGAVVASVSVSGPASRLRDDTAIAAPAMAVQATARQVTAASALRNASLACYEIEGRSWRRAKIAAWTRSCRPSLVRMLRTWVLTVCSPIARSRAICRLL